MAGKRAPKTRQPPEFAITSDDTGWRPCARSRWCARSTPADDGADAPGRGPRTFCTTDERIIAERIAELPRYYQEIAADLAEPSATGNRTWSAFGPRLPFRVADDALMRLLIEVTTSWERRVRAIDGSWREVPSPAPAASSGPLPSGAQAAYRAGAGTIEAACRKLGDRQITLLGLEPEPMERTLSLWVVEREKADQAREREAEKDAARAGRAWEPPGPGPLAWVRTAGFVRRGVDDITLLGMLGGADAGRELLALHHRCLLNLGLVERKPEDLLGVACYDCQLKMLRRADPPRTADEPLWYSQCKNCGHKMTLDAYDEHVKRLHASLTRRRRHAD